MNQIISIKRIVYLIRKDFFQIWRSLIVPIGVVMGLVFLVNILADFFYISNPQSLFNSIVRIFFMGGLGVTSFAFAELHDKSKCDDYILFPASTLDKMVSRLIAMSVIMPISILFLASVSLVISEICNAILFKNHISMFNVLDAVMGKTILNIFILQQVVFLGAAWFKKAHFIKTFLACLTLVIMLGLLLALSVGMLQLPGKEMLWVEQFPRLKIWLTVGKVGYYGLIPPLCWVLTWLCIRESQSHHGV